MTLMVCLSLSGADTPATLPISDLLTLVPTRTRLEDGGKTSYTVIRRSHFADGSIACRIDFGDGSPPEIIGAKPVTHIYRHRKGKPYAARAFVGVVSNNSVNWITQSPWVQISVDAPVIVDSPTITLQPDRSTAYVDDGIAFTVEIHGVSGAKGGKVAAGQMSPYNFFSDNDAAPVVHSETIVTHTYSDPGSFNPRVELIGTNARATAFITISAKPIPPDSTAVPVATETVGIEKTNGSGLKELDRDDKSDHKLSRINWRYVVLGIVAVIVLGAVVYFRAARSSSPKAGSPVLSLPDVHYQIMAYASPDLKPVKKFPAIEFTLRLHLQIGEGRVVPKTGESQLIAAKKYSHG